MVDDLLALSPADAIQISEFLRDIKRVVLSNQSIIDIAPLQVYASALVFSPARSITRRLFKQEERRWITTGPVVEDNWNACRQTLEGHSNYVMSVAFSPDSKLVASGSGDNTVKIWDAATGICTQTLKGHSDYVRSVAFSPDSKLVASGSYNKTVKIWDAATGICTQTLEGHGDDVSSFNFITSRSDGPKNRYHQDYGISSDGRWITRGSVNWLWLPPGCRPECSTVAASTVAIGCSSGRVLIMTFTTGS